MGHDSGPPGDDAIELIRMVDGGLTPLQAIAAGTAGSARALGLGDVAQLSKGHRADLLVVNGNPLDDFHILRRPEQRWLVLKEGGPIAGRALDPPPLTR
jgi:imidazolonepropionase-like amidohydrolase